MHSKQHAIAGLKDVFHHWEGLLGGMAEEQVDTALAPSALSTKDVVAHLRAWQMRSIARVEAALQNRQPVAPAWQSAPDPEAPEMLDHTNAQIYETYRHHPWSSVHRDWRTGFTHFLELCEQVPEADLLAEGKYDWLEGAALVAVLEGSREHHAEHLDDLLKWFRHQGFDKSAA